MPSTVMGNTKPYHTAVVIGRFQGFHNQHLKIILKALDLAHQVRVCIGSANQPRTFKNPFTFAERKDMIIHSVGQLVDWTETQARVHCHPIEDSVYNDQAWAVSIQKLIAEGCQDNDKIVLVGHEKDESSFYIKMFKNMWAYHDTGHVDILHAADIRDMYFRTDGNVDFLRGVVPPNAWAFLQQFKKTTAFAEVVKEREFVDKYKKQTEHLQYAPTYVTTDAIVIQSGHVLLVKRRGYPGKGLYAFPGGFLDAKKDKSLEDAMIRELREETGIKVPEPVLRGSIKDRKVFDAVERSARGRTITHAFKIVLGEGEWNLPKLRVKNENDAKIIPSNEEAAKILEKSGYTDPELPEVLGADDAEKAVWAPIGTVKREIMFEDHMDILNWALGR